MKYQESTAIDRRDQATRQKLRDDLARADIERADKRTQNDARIDSNASKWRYFSPDHRVK
ncbi:MULTISPECIES: hypothetical protein [Burkholderia]|uniref:hypothetical protein n=1 Tax=Burkholderia TaxID=32008 RepID=UPI000505D207|nr:MULTISPECIES: hypothetical protein [Burkholderia]EKS9883889.1 hypothetical protein [Burkholderia pyrrocinia]EKS9893564.1 hypothetical protein [Burkholderia pyrrocinia]EKS9905736.1 hypothetical protein [Burkholderia pyrrocinia]KFL52683.1 hypothetical protein JM78_14945 [Burkholderia pyrrocinia]TDA48184.1 hypothetical protein EVG18_06825 [Burkholderia pyrrocinia]